jgi:8-oxo-dGTP pyrophosphatase MutT (NUDIX family)
MSIGHFLCGIGALIWDEETSRYLLLRRAAHRDFGAGMIECVTGRVDQGESFTQALHREVKEEIGAEVQIEFIIAVTHFYLGAEHAELRWVSPQEAYAILPEGNWLYAVIHRCEMLRAQLPSDLRSHLLQSGFEV